MVDLHVRTYIHGRAEFGFDSAPVHSWRLWESKGWGFRGPRFGVWGGTEGCVERSGADRIRAGCYAARVGGRFIVCLID
jgi:hypothetical protein